MPCLLNSTHYCFYLVLGVPQVQHTIEREWGAERGSSDGEKGRGGVRERERWDRWGEYVRLGIGETEARVHQLSLIHI